MPREAAVPKRVAMIASASMTRLAGGGRAHQGFEALAPLDSDGDGYTDGDESIAGTNPYDASDYPGSGSIDSDGDGYSDADETASGTSPNDASSYPGSTSYTDSDGDGFSDADEASSGTDPYDPSSYPGSTTPGPADPDGGEVTNGADPTGPPHNLGPLEQNRCSAGIVEGAACANTPAVRSIETNWSVPRVPPSWNRYAEPLAS